MLAGAAVLFLLVMIAFWVAVRRPHWGRYLSPKQWIVGGGLVLPAIVLPPLVAWALVAGERLLPMPDREVPRIEVTAYMWGWAFHYPDHGGGTSAGVLHLPAGEPVDLHITAADVIHSFWVPQLAGKLDAIPGKINVLRLQADRPGIYQGQCAEFCGIGHAIMRFEVEVHDAARFAELLLEEVGGQ